MRAYFCGSLVLIKVSTQEWDSWGFQISWQDCQPFLGNNAGVPWGGLRCLPEQTKERLDDWETRDSWLNWRLHLGTKNLKSLGPWATYFPWKVCNFFSSRILLRVILLRNELRWVCGTYLMAYCATKLKTCRRFKTNSCYNFLKRLWNCQDAHESSFNMLYDGWRGCPLYHFFLWILRHGLAMQELL